MVPDDLNAYHCTIRDNGDHGEMVFIVAARDIGDAAMALFKAISRDADQIAKMEDVRVIVDGHISPCGLAKRN